MQAADLASWLQGEVLVGIEDHHILETQFLFLVTADQFVVDGNQALASAQSQDAILSQLMLGSDFCLDAVSNSCRTLVHLRENVGANFLETCDLAAVNSRLWCIKLFRYLVQYDQRTQIQIQTHILHVFCSQSMFNHAERAQSSCKDSNLSSHSCHLFPKNLP